MCGARNIKKIRVGYLQRVRSVVSWAQEFEMKENILVSSCLLGEKVRYNGSDCLCQEVVALKSRFSLLPVCPEIMGGLSTPRNPSERQGGGVFDTKGNDLTAQFTSGAQQCLQIAKKHQCKIAVLKAKSPSCGKGQIYDGTFSGVLSDGNGVTTELLLDNGIKVYTENDLDFLRD